MKLTAEEYKAKLANFQRTKANQKADDQIKSMFGNISVNKGIAHYVAMAPAMLGIKSMGHLMGLGHSENPNEQPINLAKSLPRCIDKEVASCLLDLKKGFHNAQTQAQIMKSNGNHVRIQDTPFFKSHLDPILKAYNVTDFDAWIPTLNTRFYFEELEIPPGLSAFFPQHNMSSPIQNVPTISGRLMGELETDVGVFSEQSESAGEVQLTTRNNVAHTKITEDLIADADPSVFERLRIQCAMALARSRDNAILNGDNSGTHMDTDVTSGKDFRKAWKGLRKLALDNSANGSVYNHGGSRPNFTLFQQLFKLAGKARYDKMDCLWLLGISVESDAVSGKIPEILTYDKAASNATIFTGNMPPILGIRSHVSEWQREDIGAAGIYAAASSLTSMQLVRLAGWLFGTRTPMKMWAAPSQPNSDLMLMSAKERIAFGGAQQGANEKDVFLGYNIATI